MTLSVEKKKKIIDLYASDLPRLEVQKRLSKELGVSQRQIRNYAFNLGIVGSVNGVSNSKVLVYDIETSRVKADLWGTGKQYVDWRKLRSDTKIISISWKWIGEDKVHALTWDSNKCDKKLVEKFLKEYNKASLVIGFNNKRFDDKIVSTRAAYHNLFINRFIASFDIMKKIKGVFKLPSYSLEFCCNYFGLSVQKLKHEGIHMWDMIEYGNKKEQKEYLQKMVDYNVGDIIATEELYVRLRPYFGTVTNVAVASGNPKWACPVSGSTDVKLHDTMFTERGTVQRIMICNVSNHQYKVSNKVYMDFLQRCMTNYTKDYDTI